MHEEELVTDTQIVSDTPPGPPMDPSAPAVDEEPPLDAVIVIKKVEDDGSIYTEVITNGSVQATEVQTLLELGVQSWRKKIGF